MMFWIRAVQPRIPTPTLLKMAGFRIAGLQGRKRPLSQSHGHLLAWNPTFKWAICLCGRWELTDKLERTEEFAEEFAVAQHASHKRQFSPSHSHSG